MNMSPLRLSVPAYYKQRQCSVDTQPAVFAAWLDQLPYANLATAIRLLADTLTELNRSPLNAPQRFELLEITQPYFNRLFEAYLQHLVQHNGDLRGLDIYEAGNRLATEMAYGYKIIVRELSEKKRVVDKALVTPLHRAMRHLAQLLMIAYYAYVPHPANIWREIHALYHYAEQRQLLDVPLKDPALELIISDEATSSISTLFKQMVLIGLLDPYRLPEGLLVFVYHYLHERAGDCLIQAGDLAPGADDRFQLELDGDAMAKPCSTEAPCTPTTRRINTHTLCERVRQDQQSLLRGDHLAWTVYPHPLSSTEAVHLLERMHQAWSHKPQRRNPRQESHAHIELVNGLQAVYCVLNGGQAFDPEHYQQGDDESIDLGAAIAHFTAAPSSHFPIEQWQVSNRSKGGLALHSIRDPEQHLGIGQLLGIRQQVDGDSTWVVSVIRWLMRDLKQRRVRLGVQFLGHHAETAVIRGLNDEYDNNKLQPALHMQLALRKGSIGTLLTPSGLFHQDTPFTLILNKQARRIVSTQLIEHNNAFDWFCFRLD